MPLIDGQCTLGYWFYLGGSRKIEEKWLAKILVDSEIN